MMVIWMADAWPWTRKQFSLGFMLVKSVRTRLSVVSIYSRFGVNDEINNGYYGSIMMDMKRKRQ